MTTNKQTAVQSNGLAQKILGTVVSLMFLIIMSMAGVLWSDLNTDIEAIQIITQGMQKEYYRIAVLENEVKNLSAEVKGMHVKLDDAFSIEE